METNNTDYIEVTAVVSPAQPWSDLLIAEMAEIGFESFEENLKGFKAYIPSSLYNEQMLDNITLPEDTEKNVSFSFSSRLVNSQNWNQEWESNFEPVEVDGQCYIRAPFHEPKPGYTYEIVIEPKMSFGTGHHATTTLMVKWMLNVDFKGKNVLDMGCGTGILAILAAKKQAKKVVAIDNFPYAYENTLENIQKNNTPDIIVKLGDASLLGNENFDIILANITRNVLKEDMSIYARMLNVYGELYISGFFEEDMPEMKDVADGCGLSFSGNIKHNEWVALKFVKNAG